MPTHPHHGVLNIVRISAHLAVLMTIQNSAPTHVLFVSPARPDSTPTCLGPTPRAFIHVSPSPTRVGTMRSSPEVPRGTTRGCQRGCRQRNLCIDAHISTAQSVWSSYCSLHPLLKLVRMLHPPLPHFSMPPNVYVSPPGGAATLSSTPYLPSSFSTARTCLPSQPPPPSGVRSSNASRSGQFVQHMWRHKSTLSAAIDVPPRSLLPLGFSHVSLPNMSIQQTWTRSHIRNVPISGLGILWQFSRVC